MARPEKATVDYFPHYIKISKSLNIIQKRYKQTGYMLWYKLLELLGDSEKHFFDINEDEKFEDFYTDCFVEYSLAIEIIAKFASLGMINKDLWQQGIIYSEHFVAGIADAYKNRKTKPMFLKDINDLLVNIGRVCVVSDVRNSVNDVENTQSRVEDIKEEEIKLNETSSTEDELEEDVFFNKFISELKILENDENRYQINLEMDKNLWSSLLEFQPNIEKVLKFTKMWVLMVSNENPIENEPRLRLYRWIETKSADDIKALKIAQAKIEDQKIKIEEQAEIAAEPTLEEQLTTKEKVLDFFSRFMPAHRGISEFHRTLMKNFDLTGDEVKNLPFVKAEIRG